MQTHNENPQSLTSPTSAALTVSRSLTGLASRWQPEEPIPARAAQEIKTILPRLRASLEPAELDAIATAVARMFDALRSLGVPVPGPEGATRAYRDALAGLPAPLVHAACRRAVTQHRYGMRLPLPAELVQTIRPELDERIAMVAKLDAMSRAPVAEDRDNVRKPTAEEKAQVSALVAAAVKALRA